MKVRQNGAFLEHFLNILKRFLQKVVRFLQKTREIERFLTILKKALAFLRWIVKWSNSLRKIRTYDKNTGRKIRTYGWKLTTNCTIRHGSCWWIARILRGAGLDRRRVNRVWFNILNSMKAYRGAGGIWEKHWMVRLFLLQLSALLRWSIVG